MSDTKNIVQGKVAEVSEPGPEWEHIAAGNEHKRPPGAHQFPELPSIRRKFTTKLDSILPPHRSYVGLSRKAFLWSCLAVGIAILVLIVGLAAGLGGSTSQNLPLPSNADHFSGDLTYYEAGLGACGEVNGQSDAIVSISHYVFDAAGSSTSTGGNSNQNPLCGMMVRATRFDEEYGARRSVDLKVADRCTGCEPTDLDTTLGTFEKLAPSVAGRVDVTWAWLQPVATG